ncbi:hypothetical protein [Gluconacetobacter johannae]|uniref:Uncharacterized protein n=1 Tax=Gluconacetobacter johannae TaxID=112140 RepID=A0A7W4P201_9PROT|nr:hypothetical protein [Gluconacetobacter johannae]MBB2174611.1 hypothetical protein [Gluconacetobacter johannae]
MNGVIGKFIGLSSLSEAHDRALAAGTWRFLERSAIGFEFLFFDWYDGTQSRHRAAEQSHCPPLRIADFEPLSQRTESYFPRLGLDLSGPCFFPGRRLHDAGRNGGEDMAADCNPARREHVARHARRDRGHEGDPARPRNAAGV